MLQNLVENRDALYPQVSLAHLQSAPPPMPIQMRTDQDPLLPHHVLLRNEEQNPLWQHPSFSTTREPSTTKQRGLGDPQQALVRESRARLHSGFSDIRSSRDNRVPSCLSFHRLLQCARLGSQGPALRAFRVSQQAYPANRRGRNFAPMQRRMQRRRVPMIRSPHNTFPTPPG